MRFWQGPLTLDVLDRACVLPECDCTQIVLSFFEVSSDDPEWSGTVESTLDIRFEVVSSVIAGPARNEPRPCGSGKKFKKCHGAPGR